MDNLFGFPIEYSLDGVLHMAIMAVRSNIIELPLDNTQGEVIFDPNVNVLAEITN